MGVQPNNTVHERYSLHSTNLLNFGKGYRVETRINEILVTERDRERRDRKREKREKRETEKRRIHAGLQIILVFPN